MWLELNLLIESFFFLKQTEPIRVTILDMENCLHFFHFYN